MDVGDKLWHFSDMSSDSNPAISSIDSIPRWNLYGEAQALPDVMHIETVRARAAGLDWHIAPHRHPHLHQFFLISEGGARIRLDGENLEAEPPFLLNVPSGTVHGFSFAAGTQGWVLTLPLQSLPEIFAPAPLEKTALGRAGILAVSSEISDIFHDIEKEHSARNPLRSVMLRARAMQLCCLLLRSIDAAKREAEAFVDPRFVQLQSLLAQQMRNGWRLRDYAAALGVSPRHLSRICHAAAGQPAAELIEAATIREACRLLVYTRASVAAVGYSLGYDDPSYFSRAFRRATGRAPSAYRDGFDRP